MFAKRGEPGSKRVVFGSGFFLLPAVPSKGFLCVLVDGSLLTCGVWKPKTNRAYAFGGTLAL